VKSVQEIQSYGLVIFIGKVGYPENMEENFAVSRFFIRNELFNTPNVSDVLSKALS
jgi:hypothetical protein